MATHSSIFVWRIPRTGEPGGHQSIGSQRVEHKQLSRHTGPSVSSLNLLENVGIWKQRLPPSMFCNHRLCKLKRKREMEQEWAIFFFSSFIVGSVYFKQFPKSVVFLLCCCTRGMMHFCENFHLPRPTPTLNLLIWRCHDLHVAPAKTLQRRLHQIEPNQSTAGKRVGACYCLGILSICTYPTALRFYFYILERVHRRKVNYFDGGGIGT